MQAKVIENNGGGLQIELYDGMMVVAVVAGIEYTDNNNGVADLKGIVDGEWDYFDASQWYNTERNSLCEKGTDGEELTALDVVDNYDSSKTIAEYDGETMHIYYHLMGHAGQRYFGQPSK